MKDLTMEGERAVIALSDNIKTIDPIGSPSVDAASERVRALMFNSLVKKDEKFDYVPGAGVEYRSFRRWSYFHLHAA